MQKDAIDRLKDLATEFQDNREVIAGLQETLRSHFGGEVQHLRSEIVMPPRPNVADYVENRRTHTKHWWAVPPGSRGINSRFAPEPIDGAPGELVVFVKAGLNVKLSALDRIMGQEEGSAVRSPFFFGSFDAAGVRIGVWEFVEGVRSPFDTLSNEARTDLVTAIAAVNGTCPPQSLQAETKWILTPGDRYRRMFKKMSDVERTDWDGLLEDTMRIVDRRTAFDDYLTCMGRRFLTHNDLNPNNVFIQGPRDVVIFDWEAATLNVAGADLRFLWRNDDRDSMIACYVAEMAKHGFELKPGNVRSAAEIIEGFRMLQKGWSKRKASPVRRGIALLQQYIPLVG